MIKKIYRKISNQFRKVTSTFEKDLDQILQFTPNKISLYQTAFQHISFSKKVEGNNERLEFLGDAILDAIIASYLYKKYPFKNEGFLTEMKSKIVNRQTLNNIGKKLQLSKLIQSNTETQNYNSHILGNTLEALIGAIYLDKGFAACDKWVLEKIIIPHVFLDKIEATEANIKNRLFQWATKNNTSVSFKVLEISKNRFDKNIFHIGLFIGEEMLTNATGLKKKEAEYNAALLAFEKLELK